MKVSFEKNSRLLKRYKLYSSSLRHHNYEEKFMTLSHNYHLAFHNLNFFLIIMSFTSYIIVFYAMIMTSHNFYNNYIIGFIT